MANATGPGAKIPRVRKPRPVAQAPFLRKAFSSQLGKTAILLPRLGDPRTSVRDCRPLTGATRFAIALSRFSYAQESTDSSTLYFTSCRRTVCCRFEKAQGEIYRWRPYRCEIGFARADGSHTRGHCGGFRTRQLGSASRRPWQRCR